MKEPVLGVRPLDRRRRRRTAAMVAMATTWALLTLVGCGDDDATEGARATTTTAVPSTDAAPSSTTTATASTSGPVVDPPSTPDPTSTSTAPTTTSDVGGASTSPQATLPSGDPVDPDQIACSRLSAAMSAQAQGTPGDLGPAVAFWTEFAPEAPAAIADEAEVLADALAAAGTDPTALEDPDYLAAAEAVAAWMDEACP